MFPLLPHLLSSSTYKSLFETTLTKFSASSNPEFRNDQIKPNPIRLREPSAFVCLRSYLYIAHSAVYIIRQGNTICCFTIFSRARMRKLKLAYTGKAKKTRAFHKKRSYCSVSSTEESE